MNHSQELIDQVTRVVRTRKTYVRYERSQSNQAGSSTKLARRTRLLIATSMLIVTTVVIVVVVSGSSQYAKMTGTPAQIRATKRVFLAANILVENLGAPTPSSESTSTWLLTSHLISKDRSGVVGAQYPWIDRSGRINVVSQRRAERERFDQGRVISTIFGDGAKNDTVAEMNQIIDGEVGAQPRISAPGGAEIVKWLKVHVDGTSAQLEADVNVWEAVLELNSQGGKYRLTRSLNLNQVDVFATLKFSVGRWSVVSFNQAPWQQAT